MSSIIRRASFKQKKINANNNFELLASRHELFSGKLFYINFELELKLDFVPKNIPFFLSIFHTTL